MPDRENTGRLKGKEIKNNGVESIKYFTVVQDKVRLV
jgi:hypothetical protein